MKRYDPIVDPYSSACNPSADMEEYKHGDYVKYEDVVDLLKEIREEAGDCMGRTVQYISDLCKIW